MKKVKTYPTTIRVSKITDAVKTRAGGLNQTRLEFFQGIRSNGGSLGALLLEEMPDGNFRVVGGNHRLQVYKNNGATEVPADVIDESLTELEIFRLAVEDNSGGSQPFTEEDLRHQIRQLLASGATMKDVIASFPSIPANFVIRAANTVKAMQAKAIANRGAILVINKGYTVKEASEQTGAPEASIRAALTPRKEKEGKSPLDVPIQMGAQGIAFRATSRRWSAWFESAEAKYHEEGYGKKEMMKILSHQKQLLRDAINAVKEREDRVEKLA
jgi:hypothetical protein